MEGNSMTFLGKCCLNFERASRVIPNVDRLVLRARYNKLFSHTNIKACYLLLVELTLDIIKGSFKWGQNTCSTIEITSDHLTKVCDDIYLILFRVNGKRFD